MKLKKLMALAVSGMLAVGMCGCGASSQNSSSGKSNNNDNTITVWAWDETFNIKALNMAKERYLKNHPDVNINIVCMAQDDVVQKLNTGLSSGTYEGLPNIALIEDYKIQNYLLSYPGEIKDLSSYIDPTKFMDYKLGFMTEGDKVYGVPFDSGVAALFYRTDYIEQAGYTKEDMQDLTWEKFIEIGKAVTEKTGKKMISIDPNSLYEIKMMMQSAGSWYSDNEGKPSISNNKALRDAVEIYKEIVNSDIAKQISGWDAYIQTFQSGDVACVTNGCWVSSSIQAAEDQKGKWAMAPIPRMGSNPESINASNSGGSSWYVLDKVGNSDLAADFLKETFASSDDLMNDLVKEINLVSTLKSASESENYNYESEFFGGQQIFKDFSKWAKDIKSVNYGLNTYALESIVAEALQSIISGGDVDEALKNAQAQADSSIQN